VHGTFRVAVLASHSGSNLQALLDDSQNPRSGYEVVLVISNNRDSPALDRARAARIPAVHLSRQVHPDPDRLDAVVVETLSAQRVDLAVTAGYLRKIGPRTQAAYQGRIVNIHPALLPRHGGRGMYGRAVHEAVLACGDPTSGASVHVVTADYDDGPVIASRTVPVLPDDTAESLAVRVLQAEHLLLPATVRALAARRDPPHPPAEPSRSRAAAGPGST